MVPVLVKPSNFISLFKKHQKYNVQVDMGALAAYGHAGQAPIKKETLLYADLQTNPDFNVQGRLGSGRSGFYSEAYLKGVGRTPLAANWINPEDYFHHSGRLPAGAGVREYVVSCWLREIGAASGIVACDGILLRPYDVRSDQLLSNKKGKTACTSVTPIDQALQAITVKSGNFCRFSNLIWMLSNLQSNTIVQLFDCLNRNLPNQSKNETSPHEIARRLKYAFDRGIENFFDFMKAGVFWGSIHNNFTVDGRFLDLEVPAILGTAMFGFFSYKSPTRGVLQKACFYEGFEYARQVRISIKRIIVLLDTLGALKSAYSTKELKMALELSGHLKKLLRSNHPVASEAAYIAMYENRCRQIFNLDKKLLKNFKSFIDAYQFGRSDSRVDYPYRSLPINLIDPEPGLKVEVLKFDQVGKFDEQSVRRANEINTLIREIEEKSEIDEVFRLLKALPKHFRRIRRKMQEDLS